MEQSQEKPRKLYYSIKEVAAMIGVSESMLRFWEKEIPQLQPKKTATGIRQYTESDIARHKTVYNLVKVRGFKLAAARKMLNENRQQADTSARILESLIGVRDELKELKQRLDRL